MYLPQLILSIASLASFGVAALNTSQSFKLVTKVKANQAQSSDQLNGLYLSGYHSGAGLNDAVFLEGSDNGIEGFFNTTTYGDPYYYLEFDLGNEFPYAAQISYPNFYAQWLPIEINAGDENNAGAYFFNETGLQFTTSPSSNSTYDSFGGWLVCNWWRGVPQLFMRQSSVNKTLTSNCADVDLLPEYI
ncbi:Hypothetical protein D9617_4g001250 [Elsinoe fawcettii]|nr:Hypothetical protein D9617_4g001250 [Elsinoe fawcettii]